jgi:plastocyanin
MLPSEQTKKLANDEGIYQIGGEKTGACQGIQANHKVTIKNGQASPLHIDAHKCDTLTFINEDNKIREIAFGEHPQHETYAGETELIVRNGQNKSITLSEPGTYRFHDHLQEETAGDFTVAP